MKELKIKIDGAEIDVSAGGPLKWKEVKTLRNLGVDDEGLSQGSPESIEKFLLFLLRRVKADVTPEQIDEMEFSDCQRVIRHFGQAVKEDVDRPT